MEPRPSGGDTDSELDRPAEADDASPITLVAQFFLIPLAVVLLAVGIFLAFGLTTREKKSPAEYLVEIRQGSLNRRWQAAFQFATELARRPELTASTELFDDTRRTFEAATEKEARRYLALALGRFARKEAVPALVTALADEDEETRLYAVLALGSVRDARAVDAILPLLSAEETALRKAAAFALGAIGEPRAAPGLRAIAEDRHFDLALQAACSLAQLHDPAGVPTLLRGLDRAFIDGIADMKSEQRAEAMVSAIQGIVLLRHAPALGKLAELGHGDPHLRVRDAALRAHVELSR